MLAKAQSHNLAAPPRFEHGLLAPQAGVISKLHYRALVFESTHLSDISATARLISFCTRVHFTHPAG